VRERFHLKRKAAWTWVMLAAEGQYYAFLLAACIHANYVRPFPASSKALDN
jgi:hypothetical protein